MCGSLLPAADRYPRPAAVLCAGCRAASQPLSPGWRFASIACRAATRAEPHDSLCLVKAAAVLYVTRLDPMCSFYHECFGLEVAETTEDYCVLESGATRCRCT